MVRVVLDGHFFRTPWTGVAYYAYGLLSALAEDARASELTVLEGTRSQDLHAWIRHERGGRRQPSGEAVSPRLHRLVHRVPMVRGVARRTRAILHRIPVARMRFDLFHALNYMPVTDVRGNVLPVVHDMSCLTNPDDHPAERVRFFEAQLARVQVAPAIHTVSQFSRNEIVRLLHVDPTRVHFIPPGADRQCLAAPLAGEGGPGDVAPLGLTSGRYIASVATLEPRKNLRTLVAAQLALDPALARRQPLVLAGAKGWGDLRMPSGLDAAVADGRIILAGYLDRCTLVALTRHARAVAYPSTYEGFGLPVLEALACGTTAVISEGTACVEAGQGAAVALPGRDVDAWARCLAALADDPLTAQRRTALRAVALAAPTWEDAAARTLRLYDELAGTPLAVH